MTRTLSVKNSSEVSSPRTLEMFIGTPPKRLLIFTGIAIPEWDSQLKLDAELVKVDLNASSNVPNPIFAATVGLASITNTDSDFTFATDDVAVSTEPTDTSPYGLFLNSNIAVLGEPSVLSRFSYQATVILETDAVISGTIRWDPSDIHHNPAMAADLFEIDAYIEKPGGIRAVQRVGNTLGLPVLQGNFMAIPYEIHWLPLGVGLLVGVEPKPGAFAEPDVGTKQLSGPIPIVLSVGHLIETPVDFLGTRTGVPH
jgi:hypothetical protein